MDILTLLSIIIPVITFAIVVLYLFKNQKPIIQQIPLPQESQQVATATQSSKNKDNTTYFLPNRVEAYQRIVLFLERISPNSLVMRKFEGAQTAKKLQAELLSTIRNEFEHNIAQQIFISPVAWKMVKDSKEEIIKIINIASSQVDENANAIELSSKIFEVCSQLDKLPTEITVEYLIIELQKLF